MNKLLYRRLVKIAQRMPHLFPTRSNAKRKYLHKLAADASAAGVSALNTKPLPAAPIPSTPKIPSVPGTTPGAAPGSTVGSVPKPAQPSMAMPKLPSSPSTGTPTTPGFSPYMDRPWMRTSAPPKLDSGVATSDGIGVGTAVNNATGAAIGAVNETTGGALGRVASWIGNKAWGVADDAQRFYLGDKTTNEYNQSGGMTGALGSAYKQLVPSPARNAVSAVGGVLNDAAPLAGLPAMARGIVASGIQAGREAAQLGRTVGGAVKNEVGQVANTFSSMAPKPAYAMATAGSGGGTAGGLRAAGGYTAAPVAQNVAGQAGAGMATQQGIGQGMQRSRLNSEVASGNLSEAGRATAAKAGWHTPEQHISGIERGNEALIKRYGIKVDNDPSVPVSASVDVAGAKNPSLLNEGASNPAWVSLGRHQAKAAPAPTAYLGGVDTWVDKQLARRGGENISDIDRRAGRAVTKRHEIREIQAEMAPGNAAKGVDPSFRRPQMENVQVNGRSILRPVDNTVVTPGLNGSAGSTIHNRGVLSDEGANLNAVGGNWRDVGQTIRGDTGEAALLARTMPAHAPGYVPPSQSGTSYGAGMARAWSPDKRVAKEWEKNLANDAVHQANKARYANQAR